MMSFPLALDGDLAIAASLNHYVTRPYAFDADAVSVGRIVAARAAAVVSMVTANGTVAQLRGAVELNRGIGMAVGVLVHHHKIRPDDALDLLRTASQHGNRTLREVTRDVVETGELTVDRPG